MQKEVLAALGRVAERLRKKLGESLNSIQKFDVPLAQATTSSLEALKAYSLGLSKYAKGDPTGAIPLFQQAIALDKATSAGIEARAAFLEALFGNSAVARRHAATCLSLGGHPTEALALAGDWVLATKEVDRVASSIPPGGSAQ